MLVSLICLLIGFVFDIVMYSLATRFTFLKSWLPYITILVIVLGVVFIAVSIAKIKKEFGKAGSRKNKSEDNHENKD